MKILATFILLGSLLSTSTLFNFTNQQSAKQWRVVDDVVMGGRSSGNMKLDTNGHGVFYGTVSTENYGGFSSIRCYLNPVSTKKKKKVVLRIKGDGKNYQFRIKPKKNIRFSYITEFKTSGKWQNVEIKLADFYPSFRGRKLDKPNFNFDQIEEIAILIGNKKNESFQLIIDEINLK